MSIKEKLLVYIKARQFVYARYLHKEPELFNWVNTFPGETIAEKCYNAINDFTDNTHYCQQCNVKLPSDSFISLVKGYRMYCGASCSSTANVPLTTKHFNSDEFKVKRKESLIERYGTDSLISINREKAIKSTQETLGVDYPLQSKDIRDKVKSNLKERHGVENVMHLPSTLATMRATFTEKYGVPHVLQNKEIYEKQQATMMERYGVKYAVHHEGFLEKSKNTLKENYGVDTPMHSDIIRNKNAISNRASYIKSGKFTIRNKKIASNCHVELISLDTDYIEGKPILWKHVCGTVYEETFCTDYFINSCSNPECKRQSNPQRAIYEYVKTLVPVSDIRVNDRSVIPPNELDIYIPSKNLAIEMDGIYWHQFEKEGINKVSRCADLGIELLHITDYSWYKVHHVWESIIATKLGKPKVIDSSLCQVKTISSQTAQEFTFINSMYPVDCTNTDNLGLYFNNELVYLMTFKEIKEDPEFQSELSSFTPKLDYHIPNLSPLIKFFNKVIGGNTLVYVKHGYGNDYIFDNIAEKIGDTESEFYYMKDEIVISSTVDIKGEFGVHYNNSLSESENMRDIGFVKVEDRGGLLFKLKV
jgi:hypothetical protein